jgi:lactate permease
MAATGLSWDVLASPAALFLGTAGLGVGLMVAHATGGWGAVRRLSVPILVMGGAMGTGQYFAATGGLWNIGGFIGGMIGLVVGFPLARQFRGEEEQDGDVQWGRLVVALSGYGILILLTLCVQLIPQVQEALGGFVLGWEFPGTETALGFSIPAGPGRKIYLLRHAGMILFTSSLLSYLIFCLAGWYEEGALSRILGGTVQRVITSSVGISSMVLMAVIMQHVGMTDALARGVSATLGRAYPLLAPWMGAMGAFMTGSNTNSNLVFAALQMRTADLLEVSIPIILAAQTSGAALGSVIAPTKVIVGASTAGMAGREGEVMRKMLLYISLLIAVISVLTIGGVWLR